MCPNGAWKVVELEESIEDEEDARLSKLARELLVVMVEHLRMIRREMKHHEDKIKVFSDENEACQRLAEIPGIGIITAIALVAAVVMANRSVQIARALMFYQDAHDKTMFPCEKPRLHKRCEIILDFHWPINFDTDIQTSSTCMNETKLMAQQAKNHGRPNPLGN